MAKEALVRCSADRLIEESKMPMGMKSKGSDTCPLTSPMRPLDPLSASSQDQGQKVISIRGKDYILFKGRILEDSEASKIYNSYLEMMNEKKKNGQDPQMDAKGDLAPGQTSQWKIDETMLLQWNILSITIQKEKDVDKFTIEDWQNVANLVPGRSVQQC